MRPLGELVRQDSVLLVRASREGQDEEKKNQIHGLRQSMVGRLEEIIYRSGTGNHDITCT